MVANLLKIKYFILLQQKVKKKATKSGQWKKANIYYKDIKTKDSKFQQKPML